MSELISRNEIIDILAKMQFFQGQRAGRELWNNKSVEVQDEDIKNFNRDIQTIRKYILQLEEKSKWISCSERLPELTEGSGYFKQSPCCLVTLEWYDGDRTEHIGWYNQSGNWNEDSKLCKVIAWMPLPPAYKEGLK